MSAGTAAGLADFVRAWSRALSRSRHVPMTHAERNELLAGLAGRVAAALHAEPFEPSAGYQVGMELVAADFSVPEALGRTINVFSTRFLDDLDATGPTPADRLAQLVEALATGFARAAHDRTLDGQEEIRLAALAARNTAEQALRVSEARSWHAARHDSLTGLPNRALFTDRLAGASAGSPTRLAVCCVDLDGFQIINDSHGHRVGDALLVAVADRLRGLAAELGRLPSARPPLVARLDGDEFALLIEDTTGPEDAVKLADQALAAVAGPYHLDERELPLSASAGVVEVPVAGCDPTEIMRAADLALHWAKDEGRACWRLFEEERNARDVARYRLSAAMPAALRRGEFTLAYQPLVNLADGRLTGVEALARWRHPELGKLGAAQFIGLAENTGLIVPLGAYLLEQACRQALRWGDLSVSVNLAVRQIREPGLAATVAEILDRTGLPPERLQLEITESAVLGTGLDALTTLRALADLGVRIAIDDFGTGYANLAQLPFLPLHGLKLAGSLVRDFCHTTLPTGDAFLCAVVALGRTLGLQITAEGIESAAQAQRLHAMGCDTGQGWHFGRPVPASRITARLARR